MSKICILQTTKKYVRNRGTLRAKGLNFLMNYHRMQEKVPKLCVTPAMSKRGLFFPRSVYESRQKLKLNFLTMSQLVKHYTRFFSSSPFFNLQLCTLTLFTRIRGIAARYCVLRSSRLKMIMQKKCCVRSNILTQRKFCLFKFIHCFFFALPVQN